MTNLKNFVFTFSFFHIFEKFLFYSFHIFSRFISLFSHNVHNDDDASEPSLLSPFVLFLVILCLSFFFYPRPLFPPLLSHPLLSRSLPLPFFLSLPYGIDTPLSFSLSISDLRFRHRLLHSILHHSYFMFTFFYFFLFRTFSMYSLPSSLLFTPFFLPLPYGIDTPLSFSLSISDLPFRHRLLHSILHHSYFVVSVCLSPLQTSQEKWSSLTFGKDD